MTSHKHSMAAEFLQDSGQFRGHVEKANVNLLQAKTTKALSFLEWPST